MPCVQTHAVTLRGCIGAGGQWCRWPCHTHRPQAIMATIPSCSQGGSAATCTRACNRDAMLWTPQCMHPPQQLLELQVAAPETVTHRLRRLPVKLCPVQLGLRFLQLQQVGERYLLDLFRCRQRELHRQGVGRGEVKGIQANTGPKTRGTYGKTLHSVPRLRSGSVGCRGWSS